MEPCWRLVGDDLSEVDYLVAEEGGLLELQVPILAMTDPGLARVLEGMQIPCYFALSWYITWFSHDVQTLTEVARLFDLFLSAHPMMPLYVGAACMAAARDELVNVEDMSLMHQALVNLRVGKYMSTDELIRQVRQHPIPLMHSWRFWKKNCCRDWLCLLNSCFPGNWCPL